MTTLKSLPRELSPPWHTNLLNQPSASWLAASSLLGPSSDPWLTSSFGAGSGDRDFPPSVPGKRLLPPTFLAHSIFLLVQGLKSSPDTRELPQQSSRPPSGEARASRCPIEDAFLEARPHPRSQHPLAFALLLGSPVHYVLKWALGFLSARCLSQQFLLLCSWESLDPASTGLSTSCGSTTGKNNQPLSSILEA